MARRLAIKSHATTATPLRKLWPGSTVVCIATGTSLRKADVDACCGRARVIAINDAYKLAPWADALYACDSRWWHWHRGVKSFAGQKYSLDNRVKRLCPEVTVLRNTGETGLELDPAAIRTGKNSGYQAINVAVHLGAKVILLLGYDMRLGPGHRSHFFGEHPHPVKPPFHLMIPKFATLVAPLMAVGVKVINCTPQSALECFPRMDLTAALNQYGMSEEKTA